MKLSPTVARAVAVVLAVAIVMAIAATGVLSDRWSTIIDDVAQLVAGTAATVCCFVTARRREGAGRRWRVLMGLGMAGWTLGMMIWAFYRSILHTPIPSPSVADIGFFVLPFMAVPATVILANAKPVNTRRIAGRHFWVIALLDCLVIAGTLLSLTWWTALGAVAGSSELHSVLGLVVAASYPLTDFVMLAMVLLLWALGRFPSWARTQSRLLGVGIAMLAISDSLFAYLVYTGTAQIPIIADVGFIAGPAFVALAAVAADDPPEERRRRILGERVHLMIPHALIAAVGTGFVVALLLGWELDPVAVGICLAIMLVGIVRQMYTLVENSLLIEQLREAQSELSHRAHHDPLTGLANRNLLQNRIRRAVGADPDGGGPGGIGFAGLLIDLDDFKAINDRYGHQEGDAVLVALGDRLRSAVRLSDTIARIGGDEFFILLENHPIPIESVVERVRRECFGDPFVVDGDEVRLGASIGVVTAHPRAAMSPEQLMLWADRAMYSGKRAGKGTTIYTLPDPSAASGPPLR